MHPFLRKDAEERYTTMPKAVIAKVNMDFTTRGKRSNKAKLIDSTALSQSKHWNSSPKRRVDWDWVGDRYHNQNMFYQTPMPSPYRQLSFHSNYGHREIYTLTSLPSK